jgi:hypothetical protein
MKNRGGTMELVRRNAAAAESVWAVYGGGRLGSASWESSAPTTVVPSERVMWPRDRIAEMVKINGARVTELLENQAAAACFDRVSKVFLWVLCGIIIGFAWRSFQG